MLALSHVSCIACDHNAIACKHAFLPFISSETHLHLWNTLIFFLGALAIAKHCDSLMNVQKKCWMQLKLLCWLKRKFYHPTHDSNVLIYYELIFLRHDFKFTMRWWKHAIVIFIVCCRSFFGRKITAKCFLFVDAVTKFDKHDASKRFIAKDRMFKFSQTEDLLWALLSPLCKVQFFYSAIWKNLWRLCFMDRNVLY